MVHDHRVENYAHVEDLKALNIQQVLAETALLRLMDTIKDYRAALELHHFRCFWGPNGIYARFPIST